LRQAYDYWQDQPGSYPKAIRPDHPKRSETNQKAFGIAALRKGPPPVGVFPECGNKPPPTDPPIKNRQTGPWGLSLAAISALNSRDGPRNRRILPASMNQGERPSRTDDQKEIRIKSEHKCQGQQARNASPRPPRGVGYTTGRSTRRNACRGAAERTHEISEDIRLRIAYQNKSNHRAPPESQNKGSLSPRAQSEMNPTRRWGPTHVDSHEGQLRRRRAAVRNGQAKHPPSAPQAGVAHPTTQSSHMSIRT